METCCVKLLLQQHSRTIDIFAIIVEQIILTNIHFLYRCQVVIKKSLAYKKPIKEMFSIAITCNELYKCNIEMHYSWNGFIIEPLETICAHYGFNCLPFEPLSTLSKCRGEQGN